MKQEEKQLLLKDLCARLPYGVKAWDAQSPEGEEVISITQVDMHGDVVHLADEHGNFEIKLEDIKLCLLPISTLTKEITIAGETFVPMKKLGDSCVGGFYEVARQIEMVPVSIWPYWITQKCIEWHIDLNGLIDLQLAISVYSLDKNPYE